MTHKADDVTVAPATPDRWSDLERLFGERGACAGCWCMHWRRPAAEYEAGKGEENREELRARVHATQNAPPGLLAYVGGEPAGWCAIAPRREYVRMERSRILAPVDDRPVWSIVCFFVARPFRRRGLTVRLIEEAVRFAADHGADIVEAYPVDPETPDAPPVFMFTGLAAAFEKAGFQEVERRSATRPIMRRRLGA